MSFWKPGSPPPNAEHKAKKPKHEQVQKVKVESGKKVKMTTASVTSSSTAAAPATLSKAVLGMKFMQRKQAEETPVVSASTNKPAGKEQSDAWFRSDHFVSDLAQAQSSTSSSSSRSRTITVSVGGQLREIEVVRSDTDVYARLPGRRSFNGCNPAMEKHYEQIISDKYIEKKKEKEERAQQKDLITDEEMADRYDQLVGLPRGPNQGKKPNKNNQNKRKQTEAT